MSRETESRLGSQIWPFSKSVHHNVMCVSNMNSEILGTALVNLCSSTSDQLQVTNGSSYDIDK